MRDTHENKMKNNNFIPNTFKHEPKIASELINLPKSLRIKSTNEINCKHNYNEVLDYKHEITYLQNIY